MELTRVDLETTITNAFLDCRRKMLPIEISSSELTNWVLEFDSLQKRDRDLRKSEDNGYNLIVRELVRESLTPNISFYYASLFHIGRQWRVSELALNNARASLDPIYLIESVRLNLNTFEQNFKELDIPYSELENIVSDSLINVLETSIEQHIETIRRAKSFWFLWQKEVGELRNIINDVSDKINHYPEFRSHEHEYSFSASSFRRFSYLFPLISFSFTKKFLFQKLEYEGTQFTGFNSSFQNTSLLNLFNITFSRMDFREFEYIILTFGKLLNEENIRLEKQRLLPVISSVQENLIKKFKGKNPFDKYNALKSPPDYQLKELWKICTLPDGKLFYYAERWINSLEPIPNVEFDSLPYKRVLEDDEVKTFARSFDSHVKILWVARNLKFGQTAKDFIQRTFEREWIVRLAIMALKPTRDSKIIRQEWSLTAFHNLLNKTVAKLKTLGYEIMVPSDERLKDLWDQASNKNKSLGNIQY